MDINESCCYASYLNDKLTFFYRVQTYIKFIATTFWSVDETYLVLITAMKL